jgi:hypothetical protein
MAFQLAWYQEQCIIGVVVTGAYPIEEIQVVCKEIAQTYLAASTAQIHLLMDLREMTSFPSNIPQVKSAADQFLKHPNLGWTVMIGKNNPLAEFFSSVIFQMVRLKFRIVHSMEDAMDILRRVDQTLPI